MARRKDSPQAIEAVYPKTEIQQCIIHQIRNSTKFVPYKDIKKLMADLKLVYAAPTEETALNELELFKDKWDSKYPKIYKSWHDNWATLSTYFKYPEAVRRLIYTTNATFVLKGMDERSIPDARDRYMNLHNKAV